MLRIPSLVNSPYVLLQYFKKSIMADNIRPLTGPYVKETVENYYRNAFRSQETDAIQDGSKREQKRQVLLFFFFFVYIKTKDVRH